MRKITAIFLTILLVCSSPFLYSRVTYGSTSVAVYVDGKERFSLTSEKLTRLPRIQITTKEGPKQCILFRDMLFSQGIGPRQKILLSKSDSSFEFYWEKLMEPSSRVCVMFEGESLSIYSEKPEIIPPEGFLKGIVRIDLKDEIITVEPEENEVRKITVIIRGKSLSFNEWNKLPVREISMDGGKKRKGWLLSDLMKRLHIEAAKEVKISGERKKDLLQLTSSDLKKYKTKTLFFINKEGVVCLESPKSMIEKEKVSKSGGKKKPKRKKERTLIKNIKTIEFI